MRPKLVSSPEDAERKGVIMKIKIYDKKGDLITEEKILGIFYHSDGKLEFLNKKREVIMICAGDYSSFYIC